MAEKIASLRTRREEHATLLKKLEDKGQTEVSLTDADARKMHDTQRVLNLKPMRELLDALPQAA